MLSQQKPIRVLVVDDSLVARNMITKGLESYPRIQVVGTAINAEDAKTKIAQLTPDAVSYTHLDVYKRQAQSPPHSSNSKKPLESLLIPGWPCAEWKNRWK